MLSPELKQSEPLFSDISLSPQKQVRYQLNRETHEWVYQLEGQNPPYDVMEKLGDGSGILGVSAAVLDQEGSVTNQDLIKARATLFDILSGSISKAVTDIDVEELKSRMRGIFFVGVGERRLPAAWVIAAVQGNNNYFPGYMEGQTPKYTESKINNWAKMWQLKASDLHKKITSEVPLEVGDVKQAELFSHMFKVQDVLAVIGDTAVSQKIEQPVSVELPKLPAPVQILVEKLKEKRGTSNQLRGIETIILALVAQWKGKESLDTAQTLRGGDKVLCIFNNLDFFESRALLGPKTAEWLDDQKLSQKEMFSEVKLTDIPNILLRIDPYQSVHGYHVTY